MCRCSFDRLVRLFLRERLFDILKIKKANQGWVLQIKDGVEASPFVRMFVQTYFAHEHFARRVRALQYSRSILRRECNSSGTMFFKARRVSSGCCNFIESLIHVPSCAAPELRDCLNKHNNNKFCFIGNVANSLSTRSFRSSISLFYFANRNIVS